jgi:hypothetical protein
VVLTISVVSLPDAVVTSVSVTVDFVNPSGDRVVVVVTVVVLPSAPWVVCVVDSPVLAAEAEGEPVDAVAVLAVPVPTDWPVDVIVTWPAVPLVVPVEPVVVDWPVVVNVSVVDTVTGFAVTMVLFAELVPEVCTVLTADAVVEPVDAVAVFAVLVPTDWPVDVVVTWLAVPLVVFTVPPPVDEPAVVSV